MKANVFCVGAGKCGTTWLYGMLRAHPECCVSNVKETMFFEHYYGRGFEWYEKHFRPSDGNSAIAEVSNTYIFAPEVAARLYEYNPNAKVVVTVRDPIERALSHYLFFVRSGINVPCFEEAIRHHEHFIWRGLFFKHVQAYLRYFAPEQIKVMVFEDLHRDSDAYGTELLRFLDLDPAVPQFDADQYRLPASKPRSKFLARSLKQGADVARELGMEAWVHRIKHSVVPKVAYRPLAQQEKPTIAPDVRSQLIDYFQADTRALSEFMGRDLSAEWFG